MLDYIEKGASPDDEEAVRCMERFYSQTMTAFQATNNERLWLKTNIKLAKLLLDRHDYAAVGKKLRELHRACQRPDGTDDPSKGTYSLEIYALEIQMHAATRNNKQLKRLYERALKVRSAVPHPKIMGIIRECGGKMHMSEENWKAAQSDFFESFRNYDEAGSLQRITVLKYLLLCTMLMRSNINPFDSQETKPYKSDPRIAAMTELVDAYLRNDMLAYERVLANNRDLNADPFIAENIDEVTRTMRTKSVLRLVKPYTRVSLAWIARQLRIELSEVRDIIGFLIIDGRIDGVIDQRAEILEMCDSRSSQGPSRSDAASKASATVSGAGTQDGPAGKAQGGKDGDDEHEAAGQDDGLSSQGDAGRTVAMKEMAEAVSELVDVLFRDGQGFRPLETMHGNRAGNHGGLSRGDTGTSVDLQGILDNLHGTTSVDPDNWNSAYALRGPGRRRAGQGLAGAGPSGSGSGGNKKG